MELLIEKCWPCQYGAQQLNFHQIFNPFYPGRVTKQYTIVKQYDIITSFEEDKRTYSHHLIFIIRNIVTKKLLYFLGVLFGELLGPFRRVLGHYFDPRTRSTEGQDHTGYAIHETGCDLTFTFTILYIFWYCLLYYNNKIGQYWSTKTIPIYNKMKI